MSKFKEHFKVEVERDRAIQRGHHIAETVIFPSRAASAIGMTSSQADDLWTAALYNYGAKTQSDGSLLLDRRQLSLPMYKVEARRYRLTRSTDSIGQVEVQFDFMRMPHL